MIFKSIHTKTETEINFVKPWSWLEQNANAAGYFR